jgi:phosphoribosylanthranilate isomerase
MEKSKTISIKICGMRDKENIAQVSLLGPQYMGFIFYEKSPRFVGSEFTIPEGLSSSIKKVGVFVNESDKVIRSKVKSMGFDFVQLHGDEEPGSCLELKDSGLKIIKAFSVDDDFDFIRTKPYKEAVDYFLFDTKGMYYGGNARSFNWSVLKKYDQEVPFFLSGGLTPESVIALSDIMDMNLHALDFNSGVELSPGIKNLEKVNEAIKLVRGTR